MCDTTGVTSISLCNPDLSPISSKEDSNSHIHHHHHQHHRPHHPPHASSNKSPRHGNNVAGSNSNEGEGRPQVSTKQNQVGMVLLIGVPIVSLVMDGKERLCLAQISSTLLKDFSYNEIHNRRVALGITCVQCTPVQLEILRRAGAMPVTSRRCGMITRREAERLCQSFLGDHAPPQLPENFAFEVYHECGWGSRGSFVPSRYNSSRAKCIRCTYCQLFFSPNKFIFHSHRLPESRYVQPDAANFNSWRRHLKLLGDPPEDEVSISSNTVSMDTAQIIHAWEDVRAMFNGGTRKRMLAAHTTSSSSMGHHHHRQNASSGVEDSHGRHSHSQPQSSRRGRHAAAGTPRGESVRNSSSSNMSGNLHHQSHNSHPSHQHRSSSSSHNTNNNLPQYHTASSPPFPNPPNPSLGSNNNASHTPVPSPLRNNNNSPISPNDFFGPGINPLLAANSNHRLENIWNPGISSHGMNPNKFGFNSQIPLPFHPLSIHWFRRPMFPFAPFPPNACGLLADASIPVAEKLIAPGGASARNATSTGTSSAFKPVARNNQEQQLFSWLNAGNGSPVINGGSGSTLPEDLSTTSNVHSNTANHSHKSADHHSHNGGESEKDRGKKIVQDTSPVSSTNDSLHHGTSKSAASHKPGRHQIQILSSSVRNESEDEENVDIESTEVEEECSSSTSFIWIAASNNNNNNNISSNKNALVVGGKQLSVSSHSDSYSGDEDEEGESGDEVSSPKRKRLWRLDSTNPIQTSGIITLDDSRGSDLTKD